AYFGFIAVATAASALPSISHLSLHTRGWLTFVLLAAAAATAQCFVVWTPRDQSYHTSIVFLIPAVLLLPPELVALMGIVQHVPEWLKLRYPWYIQSFNICNFTLNGLAGWWVAKLITHHWPLASTDARWAFSSLAAVGVFVALNHVLLATML